PSRPRRCTSAYAPPVLHPLSSSATPPPPPPTLFPYTTLFRSLRALPRRGGGAHRRPPDAPVPGPRAFCEMNSAVRNGARSHRVSDRKSTRLNSSHVAISYAVFCLKKKKQFSDLLSSTEAHTQM